MSQLPNAPRIAGPSVTESETARDAAARTRVRAWFGPFLILAGVALVVLLVGEFLDGGRGLIRALAQPNPEVGSQTLGNVGQVVAQVLGVAISVVAIIVELAANRYTHRITELFFRAKANFFVLGLFVVSGLQTLWVSFTYTDHYVPVASTTIAMVLMTISVLALLPYFSYVAAFVNPMNVLRRIRAETLAAVERGPSSDAPDKVEHVQHVAADGAEQLSDVAMNAMVNNDKGISMAAVNAIGDLMLDYLDVKSSLPKAWFSLSTEVRSNPDFVSMAEEALGEIERERTWFEFKLLRQYETIYRGAVNNYRELCYLIAINSRELAEASMERSDKAALDLAIKFFNTFMRATINARDVRTAYNVLNQYRLLSENALRRGDGRVAVAIAKYFKYYGQLAFHMDLGFILETAAYDLCALNELAFDLKSPERAELLRVFLQVDKEGEGAKKEAALRGVRKAQVKLAAYYLVRGDMTAAREVYRDMANEQPTRMASIRDELLAVDSPYFWEVTDRGMNFDWMPPDRRNRVMEFFEWFGDHLPSPRASVVPGTPAAPPPIRASQTSRLAIVSDRDAQSLVSDPRLPALTSPSDPGLSSSGPAPASASQVDLESATAGLAGAHRGAVPTDGALPPEIAEPASSARAPRPHEDALDPARGTIDGDSK